MSDKACRVCGSYQCATNTDAALFHNMALDAAALALNPRTIGDCGHVTSLTTCATCYAALLDKLRTAQDIISALRRSALFERLAKCEDALKATRTALHECVAELERTCQNADLDDTTDVLLTDENVVLKARVALALAEGVDKSA